MRATLLLILAGLLAIAAGAHCQSLVGTETIEIDAAEITRDDPRTYLFRLAKVWEWFEGPFDAHVQCDFDIRCEACPPTLRVNQGATRFKVRALHNGGRLGELDSHAPLLEEARYGNGVIQLDITETATYSEERYGERQYDFVCEIDVWEIPKTEGLWVVEAVLKVDVVEIEP